MGNTNSTVPPAGGGVGAGSRRATLSRNTNASSPSSSPSPHSSKLGKGTPSAALSSSTNSQTPSTSSQTTPGGRRKKSIELSDVDTSLSFTSPARSGVGGKSSSGSGGGGSMTTPVKSGAYRKHAERMALGHHGSGEYEEEEEYEDDGQGLGGGTLRGAMQGKAEHVVYGPRRDGRRTLATSTVQAGGLSGSDARKGDGSNDRSTSADSSLTVKPQTIALPSASLFAQSPLVDPDDTLHPGFKASPRLTSDVLLSSDQMPVIVSPLTDEFPRDSPFGGSGSSTPASGVYGRKIEQPTSLMDATATISAPSPIAPVSTSTLLDTTPSTTTTTTVGVGELLPPTTSPPHPPSQAPTQTVLAPVVPTQSLPLAPDSIPSGTGVIASPISSPHPGNSPAIRSPAVLLPPNLLNAPVAAIPIPLLSVPSATIAASLLAAAVDVGAGKEGVPTLIKWKDEDGQTKFGGKAGPEEVFVTGTFANGWKTKIELRKTE